MLRLAHTVSLVLLLVAVCGISDSLVLSAEQPLLPDWENPRVVGRNKESGHATLMPYTDPSQARTGERSQSPFFLSLNGTWKFHWSPNPEMRPRDFHRPDVDVTDWDNIPVPANWQLHGYGVPIYTNTPSESIHRE